MQGNKEKEKNAIRTLKNGFTLIVGLAHKTIYQTVVYFFQCLIHMRYLPRLFGLLLIYIYIQKEPELPRVHRPD